MAQDSTFVVGVHQMDNTADLWSILMAVALETAREGQLQEWVCIGVMTILSKSTLIFQVFSWSIEHSIPFKLLSYYFSRLDC